MKLQIYDGSVMIPCGVINIKVKWIKQKPNYSSKCRYKKGSSNISISKCSTKFSHPECKQSPRKWPDTWHKDKKKNKLGSTFKEENIGRIWRFCWYISCLPGELRLEVDKSVQPVQHMHPVAMKEEIMKKINILSRKLLQK